MTRKDYEKAAKIVREYRAAHPVLRMTAHAMQEAFAALFAGDNPRFDRERFDAACAAPPT